jgi:hypothetical protein
MSMPNYSQGMWVQPDVFGLFSVSVGSFSDNPGLGTIVFSDNLGRKVRCSQAGRFIFSGRYTYETPFDRYDTPFDGDAALQALDARVDALEARVDRLERVMDKGFARLEVTLDRLKAKVNRTILLMTHLFFWWTVALSLEIIISFGLVAWWR